MNTEILDRAINRAQRLKQETAVHHERLDSSIMASGPFLDRDRYGRFVAMQYRFAAAMEPLYRNPELEAVFPGLAARSRFDAARLDLADLGIAEPELVVLDIAPREALGWLYVSEGSTLGAAFLLKEAEKLGFDEAFGARHLAPAPDGRGLHWRRFTEQLNAVEVPPDEEARIIAGGRAAFVHVHELAAAILGPR